MESFPQSSEELESFIESFLAEETGNNENNWLPLSRAIPSTSTNMTESKDGDKIFDVFMHNMSGSTESDISADSMRLLFFDGEPQPPVLAFPTMTKDTANKLRNQRMSALDTIAESFSIGDLHSLSENFEFLCAPEMQFTSPLFQHSASPHPPITSAPVDPNAPAIVYSKNTALLFWFFLHELYPDGACKILERRIVKSTTPKNYKSTSSEEYNMTGFGNENRPRSVSMSSSTTTTRAFTMPPALLRRSSSNVTIQQDQSNEIYYDDYTMEYILKIAGTSILGCCKSSSPGTEVQGCYAVIILFQMFLHYYSVYTNETISTAPTTSNNSIVEQPFSYEKIEDICRILNQFFSAQPFASAARSTDQRTSMQNRGTGSEEEENHRYCTYIMECQVSFVPMTNKIDELKLNIVAAHSAASAPATPTITSSLATLVSTTLQTARTRSDSNLSQSDRPMHILPPKHRRSISGSSTASASSYSSSSQASPRFSMERQPRVPHNFTIVPPSYNSASAPRPRSMPLPPPPAVPSQSFPRPHSISSSNPTSYKEWATSHVTATSSMLPNPGGSHLFPQTATNTWFRTGVGESLFTGDVSSYLTAVQRDGSAQQHHDSVSQNNYSINLDVDRPQDSISLRESTASLNMSQPHTDDSMLRYEYDDTLESLTISTPIRLNNHTTSNQHITGMKRKQQ